MASYPLQLKAAIDSSHPSWAHYYKFYVKETSGEYYNLVMDALYTPTREEIKLENHVWLSFPSSDRNKISKDDYIILKRRVDSDDQISEDNKFRVLDVQNEAPDAIKYKYVSMGEVSNDASDDTGILNADATTIEDEAVGLFHNNDYLPVYNNTNNNTFLLSNTIWREKGGARLIQGVWGDAFQVPNGDLYFSFTKNISSNDNQSSERYRIVQVETSGTPNEYHIKLDKKVSIIDTNLILTSGNYSDGTTDFHKDITVKIEKKELKDMESFSGRFFVKILANTLIKNELKLSETAGSLTNYMVDAAQNVYWQADVDNDTDNLDYQSQSTDGGLLNNNYHGTYPSTSGDTVKGVTGQTSPLTVGRTAWESILDEMNGTGSTRFFIDNMHISSMQHGEYARESGIPFNGGEPIAVDDISYHCSAAGIPASRESYIDPSSLSSMSWDDEDQLAFSNWVEAGGGTPNTLRVNGLDGMAITTGDHVNPDGVRRWKTSNFDTVIDSTY